MAYLIEKLIGEGTKRRDDKRLNALVRPLPSRTRDVFDLIAAQGQHISYESIIRGVDLRSAEPAGLVFTLLGRWPTQAELAELATPYNPRQHLRRLMLSREFRQGFVRRLLDAYPERRRLIHIRIPRSGSGYLNALAPSAHPVLPLDIGQPETMEIATLLQTLGVALQRFPVTSTVFMSTDRAAPFLYPPQSPTAVADTLYWNFVAPPCRLTDLFFAVLRDPEEIMISTANAIATALTSSEPGPNPQLAPWRKQLGKLPAPGDRSGRKQLALRILTALPLQNPICTALGEGDATTATEYCRISGIALVALDKLTDWSHTTLGCEPANKMNAAPALLTRDDLTTEQKAELSVKIEQDQIFYARFLRAFGPDAVTSIPGSRLV